MYSMHSVMLQVGANSSDAKRHFRQERTRTFTPSKSATIRTIDEVKVGTSWQKALGFLVSRKV